MFLRKLRVAARYAAALVSALSSLIMGFSRRECIQISRFSVDE